MRFNFVQVKLDDNVNQLIWTLRGSYNAYDFYLSKMVESWYIKSNELKLLQDYGLRRMFGGLFLRIFVARLLGSVFIELKLGSMLMHKIYIIYLRHTMADMPMKTSQDEAEHQYIDDLKEIKKLIDAKPPKLNSAKLLIDDWIECNNKPTYALQHNFICHLFIMNNVLRLYPPVHLRWMPIFDEPERFKSFIHFLAFGLLVCLSMYWRRIWFPIAYYCYFKYPSMIDWLMIPDSRILTQIVKSGIEHSPQTAFSIFSATLHQLNPNNI